MALAALGQQQPAKLARIGFLRAAGPDNKDFTAFRSGLRALGYVEGQNIVIEQRYAAGSYDRVGELTARMKFHPDSMTRRCGVRGR